MVTRDYHDLGSTFRVFERGFDEPGSTCHGQRRTCDGLIGPSSAPARTRHRMIRGRSDAVCDLCFAGQTTGEIADCSEDGVSHRLLAFVGARCDHSGTNLRRYIPDATSDYLSRLQAALRTGDATGHTHRGALEALLRDLGKGLTVINEPRQRTDCGAPDFDMILK